MLAAGGRLERFPKGGLMDIRRVGVVGAGTMGNGIAHVFARSGYDVCCATWNSNFWIARSRRLRKNLDREVAKSKITARRKACALKRIEPLPTARDSRPATSSSKPPRRSWRSRQSFFAISTGSAGRKSFSRRILRRFRSPSWRGHQAARESHRDALLQSRAGDEIGGSDSRPGDLGGNFPDRARACL